MNSGGVDWSPMMVAYVRRAVELLEELPDSELHGEDFLTVLDRVCEQAGREVSAALARQVYGDDNNDTKEDGDGKSKSE